MADYLKSDFVYQFLSDAPEFLKNDGCDDIDDRYIRLIDSQCEKSLIKDLIDWDKCELGMSMDADELTIGDIHDFVLYHFLIYKLTGRD